MHQPVGERFVDKFNDATDVSTKELAKFSLFKSVEIESVLFEVKSITVGDFVSVRVDALLTMIVVSNR